MTERITARRIFVLTGAGVSAESGLGTFRDRGGLWARFDPMTLATPEAFARDPETVLAFYDARRRAALAARPNAAHYALARAADRLAASGGRLFLCTQNVDDLHERAGSREVVHMHGELTRVRCTACGAGAEHRGDLAVDDRCAACNRAGCLRPDIVWFGEVPKHLDRIEAMLADSDLFVAAGTSGTVHPAAGFVAYARRRGIRTCALNLEPSGNADLFEETRTGPASRTVPDFFDALTA